MFMLPCPKKKQCMAVYIKKILPESNMALDNWMVYMSLDWYSVSLFS